MDEALQLAKGSSTAVNLVKERQRRLTSELVLGGPTCRALSEVLSKLTFSGMVRTVYYNYAASCSE